MRLLFISDIHGISKNLSCVKNNFEKFECDKLIVLGDLISGPKNNSFYNENFVYDFLNSFNDKIVCLKGNCDFGLDFSLCNFDIYDGLNRLDVDGSIFYLNHGHVYNYDNLGEIDDGILIYGHEHKPYIRKKGNVLCINPGSISLSRSCFKESYLIYDDGKFIIYDIENNIIDEYNLLNYENRKK